MLKAIEDGKRPELFDGWWRLSEFRVRIWDPMGRLRWTPATAVANVLGNDTADVIDAEEEEVVQSLLLQRAKNRSRYGEAYGAPYGMGIPSMTRSRHQASGRSDRDSRAFLRLAPLSFVYHPGQRCHRCRG